MKAGQNLFARVREGLPLTHNENRRKLDDARTEDYNALAAFLLQDHHHVPELLVLIRRLLRSQDILDP